MSLDISSLLGMAKNVGAVRQGTMKPETAAARGIESLMNMTQNVQPSAAPANMAMQQAKTHQAKWGGGAVGAAPAMANNSIRSPRMSSAMRQRMMGRTNAAF